ncbi:unnamed protein product [Prorocentrum cordatum]|uniref:Uncharacterized protein n=1 Tax=Prorocentrum cordatum TaxID=2364126 RepID=A0ABN9THM0_9DINO|nr:unnamed protein product [Polarella glacialis]
MSLDVTDCGRERCSDDLSDAESDQPGATLLTCMLRLGLRWLVLPCLMLMCPPVGLNALIYIINLKSSAMLPIGDTVSSCCVVFELKSAQVSAPASVPEELAVKPFAQ